MQTSCAASDSVEMGRARDAKVRRELIDAKQLNLPTG